MKPSVKELHTLIKEERERINREYPLGKELQQADKDDMVHGARLIASRMVESGNFSDAAIKRIKDNFNKFLDSVGSDQERMDE